MTATDAPVAPIRLAAGDVVCDIAPALGGSLLRLACRGIDLLRVADAAITDVLDAACFTMLPFANRIGEARLSFDGIAMLLEPDGPCAPHALHGHGWRAAWRVASRDARHAVLELDHAGKGGGGRGWDWRYRARQAIAIVAGGIAIDVTIENLDLARAMPAGAGIHPYFNRRSSSRISAAATAMWRNDATNLAVERIADDRFRPGVQVPVDMLAPIDNWFESNNGLAMIADAEKTVRVSGAPATGFHLYAPAGGDFFCVEPVSHAPNAFGRGEIGEHDVIAAGGRRHWRFTIVGDAARADHGSFA